MFLAKIPFMASINYIIHNKLINEHYINWYSITSKRALKIKYLVILKNNKINNGNVKKFLAIETS